YRGLIEACRCVERNDREVFRYRAARALRRMQHHECDAVFAGHAAGHLGVVIQESRNPLDVPARRHRRTGDDGPTAPSTCPGASRTWRAACASTTPRRRASSVETGLAEVTSASWVWPSSKRCSAANRPPLTLSEVTVLTGVPGSVRSTITMGKRRPIRVATAG